MDLMKRIFAHTGSIGPVITNGLPLKANTMIDEDEYDTIDNGIFNCDNSFQP